ncbi:flotillin family protein [soil metagenome]
MPTLPVPSENSNLVWLGLVGAVVLVFLFAMAFLIRQYKRCPSNRILVVFGKVGGQKASKCLHGGGIFIVPLIQDYAFLSLEPLVIDIPLQGALSQNNIRVNVPATFTVGISTDPVLMNNAAERLLGLLENSIREQAQDIILGQLRLVIATLTIEEINRDREKFMTLINENVGQEINKVGLTLINVNVRDITDESGYIEAIGKRAAAEAINRAKVEVAQQDREGAMGEAIAVRERTVKVSAELATGVEGQKLAEQRQRVALADLEMQAVRGEAESRRASEIAVAQRGAEVVAGRKLAEQEQRIKVAEAEAIATTGENESRARMAQSNALLAEISAEAKRRGDVANAEAAQHILLAQRGVELARLSKDTLAAQEIEKQRIEIAADAEAGKLRREAAGHADAILARYEAEAAGVQKVLEAKAEGYRKLLLACAANPSMAPTLLMIEKLPEIVAEQVKAIQNLRIDKITIWDGGAHAGDGGNGKGATANFLAGMIGALPPMHELAKQAGIQLPAVLGTMEAQGAPAAHSGTREVATE